MDFLLIFDSFLTSQQATLKLMEVGKLRLDGGG